VDLEAVALEGRLPLEVETTIYWVVQEALTNVLRRGMHRRESDGATRVSLLLQRRGVKCGS
jgi:signal transduction histidine kinase